MTENMTTFKSKPIIILGSGRHAKVLISALKESGHKILGVTDPNKEVGDECLGVRVLGNDNVVFDYSIENIALVNGIAEFNKKKVRSQLTKNMEQKGYSFAMVIHPSAIIANDVELHDGVQIMAGVVIQPGVKIGKASIINTGAIVDHDCVINENCHIAPGVILNGSVVIGHNTHIGTGSSIIQDVHVGKDCIVAAGSVVYKNVPDNKKIIQLRKEFIRDIESL